MDYKEYQELSSKTFAQSESQDSRTIDLLHCAIGATTEAGELLDAFKKHIYYKKELDIVNIGEEIADIQWYLFNLCRLLDLDMEKLLESNITKLKSRYGDKFSTERAVNRDLETERGILEKTVLTSEYRDIETGGLKPPKVEWISHSETIDNLDKEVLKKELLDMYSSNSVVDVDVMNVLFSLSDVSSCFSYLEDSDVEFLTMLVSNEESVKNILSSVGVNLEPFRKRLNSVQTIALVVSFLDDDKKFVALINFDQLNGVLKLDTLLGDKNTTISLEGKQLEEFNNYLEKHLIKK